MKRLLVFLLVLLMALGASAAQIWTVNSAHDVRLLNANSINTNVFAVYGLTWNDNLGGMWTFIRGDISATNDVNSGGPMTSLNPISPVGRWFQILKASTPAVGTNVYNNLWVTNLYVITIIQPQGTTNYYTNIITYYTGVTNNFTNSTFYYFGVTNYYTSIIEHWDGVTNYYTNTTWIINGTNADLTQLWTNEIGNYRPTTPQTSITVTGLVDKGTLSAGLVNYTFPTTIGQGELLSAAAVLGPSPFTGYYDAVLQWVGGATNPVTNITVQNITVQSNITFNGVSLATVNPSDNRIPVRASSTNFADSPLTVSGSDIIGDAGALFGDIRAVTNLQTSGAFKTASLSAIVLTNGMNTITTSNKAMIVLISPATAGVSIQLNSGSGTGSHIWLVNFYTNACFTLTNGPVADDPVNKSVYVRGGIWSPTETGETLELLELPGGWVEVNRSQPVSGTAPGMINPTDGYLPYRSNATTFGDSPFRVLETNVVGFAADTNSFFWQNQYGFAVGKNARAGNVSTSIGDMANYQGTNTFSVNLGQLAGYYNQGSVNTFLGNQAAGDNVGASYTVAIGTGAAARNGSSGVHIGVFSSYTGTNVDAVVIGHYAGYGTTGTNDVHIGESSGFNATGTNNTTVGAYSAFQAAGHHNTAIGAFSLYPPVPSTVTNTISIGSYVRATNDNEIVIGNTYNTKAIFPITSYTGAGTQVLTDDGTYKTVSGAGGLAINATDTYLPARMNATTFTNSPLWVANGTNIANNGVYMVTNSGTAASPAYSLSTNNSSGYGLFLDPNNEPAISVSGSEMLRISSAGIDIPAGNGFDWRVGDPGSTPLKQRIYDDGSGFMFEHLGTNVGKISTTSGYSGAGTKALTDDGTYKPFAGSSGTTINPTDGYLPYRSSATTFGDSPWYRVSASELGFGSTDSFLVVNTGNKSITIGNSSTNALQATLIGHNISPTNKATYSTAVGAYALGGSSGGSYNTVLGRYALFHVNGANNTAIGESSAYRAINWTNNITIGSASGLYLTNGADNIIMGSWPNVLITNLWNSIIIGNRPTATPIYFSDATNAIVLGNDWPFYASNTTIVGNTNTTTAIVYAGGYDGSGTHVLTDDGTYKTVSGAGGTAINATDTYLPARMDATTFTNSPLYTVAGTNIATDGQIIFGPGTTNYLYKSPSLTGGISYKQSDSENAAIGLENTNGLIGYVLGTSSGPTWSGLNLVGQNFATLAYLNTSPAGGTVGSVTIDQDGFRPNVGGTIDLGSGYFIAFRNAYLSNSLTIDGWHDATGTNWSRTVFSHSGTNGAVVFDSQSSGIAGSPRIFQFDMGTTNIFDVGRNATTSYLDIYSPSGVGGLQYGARDAGAGYITSQGDFDLTSGGTTLTLSQSLMALYPAFAAAENVSIGTASNPFKDLYLKKATLNSNGDMTIAGMMHATNGYRHELKNSFSTNYTCTTNTQFYLVNGTNQLLTLPSAASAVNMIYRFSMTNGYGSFVITNSGDSATIRDGTSLSYTNIGVNEVGFISDGANWWLSSKGKQIFPSASWSLTNTITPAQDTITNIPLTTLEFNNSQGITLKTKAGYAAATELWITNSGTYMITFSAVLKGSGNATGISIWLRKDGTDVPRSRTDQKFTSANAQQCMTVNYFVKVGLTPSYFELCAGSHDASCPTIVSDNAAPTGFTAPYEPGLIVTINRVSDTWP